MNRESSQHDSNTIMDTLNTENMNPLKELKRKVIMIIIPHTKTTQKKD